MTKFRTPRRRLTRQRSGFKVAGDNKGSTCKIIKSTQIDPVNKEIIITAKVNELKVPALFRRDFGIIGVGYYYLPHGSCENSAIIQWNDEKDFTGNIRQVKVRDTCWQRAGAIFNIPTPRGSKSIKNIVLTISFKIQKPLDFFGLTIGAIEHVYLKENDVYDAFLEKTLIYIPEILYQDPTAQSLKVAVARGNILQGKGAPIICKSCNRCSRYLPVDIYCERNTLSFSNHCVSRAPCKHASFSQYYIDAGDASLIADKVRDGYVISRLGHQLECIVCKKFFVNLPLNPLRDSTQHREDSLRRRAFEVLANQLLARKWIYHSYRLVKGAEFDVAIWEKFDKKCFNCGKELKTPNDMDLDHTLPLAYLWPLDRTATCLCSTCNSAKSDKFPIEFYPESKLPELSKLTNVPLSFLKDNPINKPAVDELFKKVVWFFDTFLKDKDYQKVRKGKRAADLILHALHNVLRASGYDIDLVALYVSKKGAIPKTVTIQ